MEIAAFGMTDVGCRREKNEDSYLIDTNCDLYVVADGMGGHLGGEFASRLAIATIEEAIQDIRQDPEVTLQTNIDVTPGDYKSYLKYAISIASNRIFDRAAHDPSLHGMGTTVVAIIFHGGRAYLANVGDSRCYLVRGGKIKQLTQDHSLVGEQLRAGIIGAAEVKNHKFKNIITRSVGFQEGVEIDISSRAVKTNDKFVLCTDGLTNMVPNEEILSIVSNNPPNEACNQLINLANKYGGEDNITVVITEALESEGQSLSDEETQGL